VPGEEFGYLACDVASKRAAEFAAEGRVGVVVRQFRGGGEGDGEAIIGRNGKEKVAPVLRAGTIVFAEVLGRTLGGRPLLSARRLFRRVAWHRARQVLYAAPFFCCWKSFERSLINSLTHCPSRAGPLETTSSNQLLISSYQ
jgi:hypothetical protein